MFVSSGNRWLAATLAVGLAVSGTAGGLAARSDADPDRSGAAALRHFSADMVIRHRRYSAAGAQLGPDRGDVVLTLVRQQRGGRWVTTLSADRSPGALIEAPGGRTTLDNPFLVSRVELDDDNPQVRMFDRWGQPVRPMTPEDLRLVGAAAGLRSANRSGWPAAAGGALVAEPGGRSGRHRNLVSRFGAAVGRVRGLDRFVTTDEGGTHEVLATPDTVLPVEVTTRPRAGGDLRTAIEYESRGRFGYVRRLLRSELRFPAAGGHAVTEVELANVVLSDQVLP